MGNNFDVYRKKVIEVVNSLLKHSNISVEEGDCDVPLTGEKFGFDGIAMMYLYMALENQLKVKFNIQPTQINMFYTINSISHLINERYSNTTF